MDMKGKVKKILAYNTRELRASGVSQANVQSLSPLQREIDELLQYSASIKVEDLSDEYGAADAVPSPSLDRVPDGQLAPSPVSSRSDKTVQHSRSPRSVTAKRKRRRPIEDERYALLKKQTMLMQQSVVRMAAIGDNVAKLVGALTQQTLVLKQAVKLMEKHIGSGQ